MDNGIDTGKILINRPEGSKLSSAVEKARAELVGLWKKLFMDGMIRSLQEAAGDQPVTACRTRRAGMRSPSRR